MIYDCQRTGEFLGLYLDNELDAVPTQRVAAHLSTCPSCRRELELLRSETELLVRSIKSVEYDTEKLRASIKSATVGRRGSRWPRLMLPRVPQWAVATACAFVVAVVVLFYLTGRMAIIGASPLYSAAADNHRTCIEESEKPDWARTESAIDTLRTPFPGQLFQPPHRIGSDLTLARARICELHGKNFLHLVYVSRDGTEASVFVGRNEGLLPQGDQDVTLGNYAIQLTEVANLHIASTQVGECLMIAASNAEDGAAMMLLDAATGIRQ